MRRPPHSYAHTLSLGFEGKGILVIEGDGSQEVSSSWVMHGSLMLHDLLSGVHAQEDHAGPKD